MIAISPKGKLGIHGREFLREEFWSGGGPLWNPWIGLGRPFVADMETTVCYPPTWLFVVLPTTTAYVLVTGGHVGFGGFMLNRLARRWGCQPSLATALGAAFAANTMLVSKLSGGLVNCVHVICYIPVIWWVWEELVETGGRRRWVGRYGRRRLL